VALSQSQASKYLLAEAGLYVLMAPQKGPRYSQYQEKRIAHVNLKSAP
jgi:hypothetical protein